MRRKLFGTDGVRGRANAEPMTAATALRLGMAAGAVFTRGEHRHTVVIGKDTLPLDTFQRLAPKIDPN